MKIKLKAIYIAIFVFLILNSNTDAKGGRGGGSRGSFSRGSSSRGSSGFSWFGSRPSPSYSRPSPSYTHSRPSPSYTYSKPSSSYGWNTGGSSFGSASKPSSTNYGWNIGSNTGSTNIGSKPSSTSYGWNVGSNTGSTNRGSKPSSTNYGWNINNAPKPSAPVGPPPAYPGLQNRPVPSFNSPPAYSPSFKNPPAYSPSHFNSPSYRPSYSPSYSPSYNSPSYNSRPSTSYGSGSNIPRQNVYGTYSSNPGYYSNSHQKYYGNTFGSHGLPGNTYISNNYYGNQRSGGSGFLTNALFYGAGMHSGYGWGRSSGYYGDYHHHHHHYHNRDSQRRWDEEEDRKWRATTKAPYFENKVPGGEKILPASAVIGAATAFGLASLLPLNVPSNMPLMYCNSTDLMQSQIQINNEFIYQCINGSVVISCSKLSTENKTEEVVNIQMGLQSNRTKGGLVNQTDVIENHTQVLDNQTATQSNQTDHILNQSEMPENQTELPINQRNQTESDCTNRIMRCDLSDAEVIGNIYCKMDVLMSKSFIFCNSTSLLNVTVLINGTNINTTTTILNCFEGQLPENQASFIPTTSTTQAPTTTTERSLSFGARAHMFFLRIIGHGDIAEQKPKLTPIAEDIPQLSDNETWIPEALTIPPETTTLKTEPTTSTTENASNKTTIKLTDTTTEDNESYEWMRPKSMGDDGFEMEPVPKNLLEPIEKYNSSIPSEWIKVSKNGRVNGKI